MPQFVMHQFMQLGDNDLAELASSFGKLSFDDPFFCSDVPPTQRCLEHPLGDAAVLQQMLLARPSLIGLLFLVSVKRQQVVEPDAFTRRKRAFVDEYALIVETSRLQVRSANETEIAQVAALAAFEAPSSTARGRARGPPVRLYTRVAFRSAARAASLSSRPVQALCESGGPKTGRASTPSRSRANRVRRSFGPIDSRPSAGVGRDCLPTAQRMVIPTTRLAPACTGGEALTTIPDPELQT